MANPISRAGVDLAARIREQDAELIPDSPSIVGRAVRARSEAERLDACFHQQEIAQPACDTCANLFSTTWDLAISCFAIPTGARLAGRATCSISKRSLERVPGESVAFHAQHNHFSNWLMARTEFELASRLQPKKISDFQSLEAMRNHLIQSLAEYREKNQTGVITDFTPSKFDVPPTALPGSVAARSAARPADWLLSMRSFATTISAAALTG
jgi:hypothetical protein